MRNKTYTLISTKSFLFRSSFIHRYIFVDIQIDIAHFVDSIQANFEKSSRLALVSTIQFVTSLQATKQPLIDSGYSVIIPQCLPLSPGEILGCTSPKVSYNIKRITAIMFTY